MTFRLNQVLCGVALGASLLCAGIAAQAADIKERTIKFAMQNSAGSAQYDAAVKVAEIVKGVEELKAKGMQINELPAAELAKMKDKAKPVVDKYTKIVGEPLVKDLYAAADKARAGQK